MLLGWYYLLLYLRSWKLLMVSIGSLRQMPHGYMKCRKLEPICRRTTGRLDPGLQRTMYGMRSLYGHFSTITNATTQFFKSRILVIRKTDSKRLWRNIMSTSLFTDNQMLFDMYVASVVASLRLMVDIVRAFKFLMGCSHILIGLLRQMSSNRWRRH
jgi:hypothetical protein